MPVNFFQFFKALHPEKNEWVSILILMLTSWVAHFYFFQNFGLYEDDYHFVGLPMQWGIADYWYHTQNMLTTWPQGRPVGTVLPQLLAFVGLHTGGISGVYLIGYVIVTLNAIVFYTITKSFLSSEAAFIGALIFCLFPADTTHTLLTHSLQLQTSLLFALIASYCLLHQNMKTAYFLGTLCLLTYEIPFLILFWIPLLNPRLERPWLRKMIQHFVLLCLIVLVVFAVRKWIGEDRAAQVDLAIFQKILISLFLGPWTVISSFLETPSFVLSHLNQELGILIFVFFTFFLWRLTGFRRIPPHFDQKAVKVLCLSMVIFLFAYFWSFTHFPPTTLIGRLTSVHLAAAFGASLLGATLAKIATTLPYLKQFRIILLYGIALYLGILVGYRWMIQKDFEQSWQNQRAFWTEVHYNLGDITDGTLVIANQSRLPKTRFVATHSWADFMILEQLYTFPSTWKFPPRLYLANIQHDSLHSWQVLLNSEWSEEILEWSKNYSKVILLVKDARHSLFFRPTGTLRIGQNTFELMAPAFFNTPLEKAPLFKELIIESDISQKDLGSELSKTMVDQTAQRQDIRKLQKWLNHVDPEKYPKLRTYLQSSIQKIHAGLRY